MSSPHGVEGIARENTRLRKKEGSVDRVSLARNTTVARTLASTTTDTLIISTLIALAYHA